MSEPLPRERGFRMPAEWEPHAATWLAWPHNPETWPDAFEPIPAVWAEMVRHLAEVEPVRILAGGEAVRRQAEQVLAGMANVELLDIVTNDCWVRDYGPTFLLGPPEAPLAMVDWDYDAWGGKYPPYDDDQRVARQIAGRLGCPRFAPGIVFEGGALEVNGRGSVMVSEQCLLEAERNPGLSRADYERLLRDYLDAPHVIWIGRGIVGDDTDGHVDQLARFVGERTVVTAVEEDPRDENFAPLKDNVERLRHATDQDGRPLEVIPLPMPAAKYFGDRRLPASYANFYIANGVVLVPTFDDPADAAVLEIIGRCFPERRVRPLRSIDLVWGLGGIHCVSQQQPATFHL